MTPVRIYSELACTSMSHIPSLILCQFNERACPALQVMLLYPCDTSANSLVTNDLT